MGRKLISRSIYIEFDEYREGKAGRRACPLDGQEETKEQRLNGQGLPRVKIAPSSNLRIDNIPEECTDEDLLKHFEDHNWRVTDCVIPKEKSSVNKGIGVVSFAAVDEAVAAKRARDSAEVFREKIRIDFVVEAEEGRGNAGWRGACFLS